MRIQCQFLVKLEFGVKRRVGRRNERGVELHSLTEKHQYDAEQQVDLSYFRRPGRI